MGPTEPLVTIMMPAYNAGDYIADAIESVLLQTYETWELIIVDDDSDDDTLLVATDYSINDPRIRLFASDHRGCPAARNTCLEHAQGTIVARLDADDVQDPERLEKQVHYLLRNTDKDIVTCGMVHIHGNKFKKVNYGPMVADRYMAGDGGRPVNASIVAWDYVYNAVKFNSHLLAGSDGDWNFKAILEGFQWGYVDSPLYYYRRHPDQITRRMRKDQFENHNRSRLKYSKLYRERPNV